MDVFAGDGLKGIGLTLAAGRRSVSGMKSEPFDVGLVENRMWCPDCKRHVLAKRQGVSRSVAWLIVGGLWVVAGYFNFPETLTTVAIILSAAALIEVFASKAGGPIPTYRCHQCGERAIRKKPKLAALDEEDAA